MKNFYVNNKAQSNGDHEVHEEGCRYMPSDKKHLGSFSLCSGGITEAKITYSTANGCKTCSPACHTS